MRPLIPPHTRRLALVAGLTAALSCTPGGRTAGDGGRAPGTDELRRRMVERQIQARGVNDAAVLAAMGSVPRHLFVPDQHQDAAYEDAPLPIGHGQTISQPYVVALMTELAAAGPGDRVLEIGTGSGYQAAVLAALGCEVHSIEIIEPLALRARSTLAAAGYTVQLRTGDGYAGWPEAAPFDAILLTAAPPEIPQPLLEQLAEGGRLVAPVGDVAQKLVVVRKVDGTFQRRSVLPVRFVPMTGAAQRPGTPE